EVLLATAVPSVTLVIAQVLLATAAAAALFDLAAPVNPVLILVGVLGGAGAFVLLAAVSTAFTRNVEMAQLTTLPVLLVNAAFAGLAFPVDMLPDVLAKIGRASCREGRKQCLIGR